MHIKLEDSHTFRFVTSRFSSGAAYDATGTPTCEVFEEATDTAIVTPTVVKPTGTGEYRVTVACTAANGFEAGKLYNVQISATVDSVAAAAIIATFKVTAVDIDDTLAADVVSISGDATSADNLELQYDGTGLTGDTYPATQAQVGSLSVGAGGLSIDIQAAATVTTGTQTSGTYTDTQELDGTVHTYEDVGNAIDFYYEADVGNSGAATAVLWNGYVQGNNKTVAVYGYDWVAAGWKQIGTIAGQAGTTVGEQVFSLTAAMTGTGANIGEVRVRFQSADIASVSTDRLWVEYTALESGIPNGSTVTLSASATNEVFFGHNWTLALGGQDITGSYFYQATMVTGTGTGTNGTSYTFQECNFGAVTLDAYGFLHNSALGGTLTLASTAGVSNDFMSVFSCFSGVAGAGAPTIDASAVTKTTFLQIRDWNGGITVSINSSVTASVEVAQGGTSTLTNAGGTLEFRGHPKAVVLTTTGAGTTNIVVANGAPISISGTGGTINVYGNYGAITDTSTGTTINEFRGQVDADVIRWLGTAAATPTVAGVPEVDITHVDGSAVTGGTPDVNVTQWSGTNVATPNTAGTPLVDVGRINDSTAAAIRLALSAGQMIPATVDTVTNTHTPTTTEFQADDITEATADHYNGRIVIWTSGSLLGQATDITDYAAVGGIGQFTVTAMTEAPANNDTFLII